MIAAKNAKKIIASSKFIKDKVKKLYDVDDDHVEVIFPGYADKIFYKKDVDKKKLFKKLNLNISLDAKIINFVGSISKTKGFDILLQANKMIMKNENIHFFVFGGGDVKDVMDKDLIDKYSLENIHFFGYQTQDVIADAHNIAKAGILPSREEGFGIACLESMGCSLPVIVSDSGGQKEFVVGKIVETRNPQKLKDAILAIINMDPNSYNELSQKALNQAKKYTWDKMLEKRIQIFIDGLK